MDETRQWHQAKYGEVTGHRGGHTSGDHQITFASSRIGPYRLIGTAASQVWKEGGPSLSPSRFISGLFQELFEGENEHGGGVFVRSVYEDNEWWVFAGRVRYRYERTDLQPTELPRHNDRYYCECHFAWKMIESLLPLELLEHSIEHSLKAAPLISEESQQEPFQLLLRTDQQIGRQDVDGARSMLTNLFMGRHTCSIDFRSSSFDFLHRVSICLACIPSGIRWRVNFGAGLWSMPPDLHIGQSIHAIEKRPLDSGPTNKLSERELEQEDAIQNYLLIINSLEVSTLTQLATQVDNLFPEFAAWDCDPRPTATDTNLSEALRKLLDKSYEDLERRLWLNALNSQSDDTIDARLPDKSQFPIGLLPLLNERLLSPPLNLSNRPKLLNVLRSAITTLSFQLRGNKVPAKNLELDVVKLLRTLHLSDKPFDLSGWTVFDSFAPEIRSALHLDELATRQCKEILRKTDDRQLAMRSYSQLAALPSWAKESLLRPDVFPRAIQCCFFAWPGAREQIESEFNRLLFPGKDNLESTIWAGLRNPSRLRDVLKSIDTELTNANTVVVDRFYRRLIAFNTWLFQKCDAEQACEQAYLLSHRDSMNPCFVASFLELVGSRTRDSNELSECLKILLRYEDCYEFALACIVSLMAQQKMSKSLLQRVAAFVEPLAHKSAESFLRDFILEECRGAPVPGNWVTPFANTFVKNCFDIEVRKPASEGGLELARAVQILVVNRGANGASEFVRFCCLRLLAEFPTQIPTSQSEPVLQWIRCVYGTDNLPLPYLSAVDARLLAKIADCVPTHVARNFDAIDFSNANLNSIFALSNTHAKNVLRRLDKFSVVGESLANGTNEDRNFASNRLSKMKIEGSSVWHFLGGPLNARLSEEQIAFLHTCHSTVLRRLHDEGWKIDRQIYEQRFASNPAVEDLRVLRPSLKMIKTLVEKSESAHELEQLLCYLFELGAERKLDFVLLRNRMAGINTERFRWLRFWRAFTAIFGQNKSGWSYITETTLRKLSLMEVFARIERMSKDRK